MDIDYEVNHASFIRDINLVVNGRQILSESDDTSIKDLVHRFNELMQNQKITCFELKKYS